MFMDSAKRQENQYLEMKAELFVNGAIETVKMPRDIASKEKTSGIYFDAPDFFLNRTVLDEMELRQKLWPLKM